MPGTWVVVELSVPVSRKNVEGINMSTDTVSNQTVKDVLNASVVRQGNGSQGVQQRQSVAATNGTQLPPSSQGSRQPDAAELQQAVSQLNEHVQQIQRDLEFSIDESSGKTVVKVLNSENGEVVRQIPSDEMLRIARIIKEQMDDNKGLIFETSA